MDDLLQLPTILLIVAIWDFKKNSLDTAQIRAGHFHPPSPALQPIYKQQTTQPNVLKSPGTKADLETHVKQKRKQLNVAENSFGYQTTEIST